MLQYRFKYGIQALWTRKPNHYNFGQSSLNTIRAQHRYEMIGLYPESWIQLELHDNHGVLIWWNWYVTEET